MTEKILFVDDEVNILSAYRRSLRKQFTMDIAESGEEALERLQQHGPYGVIVSDMRMPGMDGIELLTICKQRYPDTIRIMLTGNAEQQTAIDAVNKGDIFHFLTKPCGPIEMAHALESALEQRRLIVAERELLEKTLRGSVHVLTEVLSLTNPEAFGRMARIKRLMRRVGEKIGIKRIWWLETLAMMSQIGCVILPDGVLEKVATAAPLTEEERQLYEMAPCVAADMVRSIPRLDEMASSIQYQQKNFDGSGPPNDEVAGQKIPAGARLLKVVLDFDAWEASGLQEKEVLARMLEQRQRYDPAVLSALRSLLGEDASLDVQELKLFALEDGMIFHQDVKTHGGVVLVCKGREVSLSVRERLRSFVLSGQVSEPFRVIVPQPDMEQGAESN